MTDDIVLSLSLDELKEIIPELGIRKKFLSTIHTVTAPSKESEGQLEISKDSRSPPAPTPIPSSSSAMVGLQGETVNIYGPVGVTVDSKIVSTTEPPISMASNVNADSIWFNVRDPIDSFSGREAFLKKLHVTVQKGGVTILSQVQVISGFGGVGKTEAARKYITTYGRSSYKNVIWINAESRNTMRDSFLNLAERHLNIHTKERSKDLGDLVTQVYHKLCLFSTLIIFDNAENYDKEPGIRPFLPNTLPPHLKAPFVLVTSRRVDWFTPTVRSRQVISLEMFTDNECVNFILEQLSSSLIDDDQKETFLANASKLGSLLGGLPLALQQAIAYIRNENEITRLYNPVGYSISDYIAEFEKRDVQRSQLLLNYPPDDSYNYKERVTTTWTITFDKISATEPIGPLAITVLEILALFHADAIPINFLLALYPNEKQVEVSKSLLLLKSYAMVTMDGMVEAGTGFVTIHRLVQHILLNSMTQKSDEMIGDLIVRVIKPGFQKLKSLPLSAPNYDKVLNNLLSLVDKFDLIQPPRKVTEVADYRYELALFYTEFGNTDQACALLQRQLDFENQVLGPSHPKTLRTENQMGFLLRLQGKFAEALTLHQENYERIKKFLGLNTPLLMTCMHNMAFALQEQGRLPEAMEMYKKAYEGRQKILGPEHEDCMGTLNNIANVYFWDGKYNEALDLYRQVNENRTKALGPLHTLSIISLQNIANVFEAQGDYEAALQLFQQCLERWKETVGPNHRDTILAMEGIAEIHGYQNRLQENMAMLQQVHLYRKKYLGNHHPETLRVQTSIALVLRDQGSHQEALSLLEDCFAGLSSSYGLKHSVALEIQHYIATVMAAQGFFQQALDKLKSIHVAQVENSGPEHPDCLETLHSIGGVLAQLGRKVEALETYQNVFQGRKSVFGPGHPKTLLTKNQMDELQF